MLLLLLLGPLLCLLWIHSLKKSELIYLCLCLWLSRSWATEEQVSASFTISLSLRNRLFSGYFLSSASSSNTLSSIRSRGEMSVLVSMCAHVVSVYVIIARITFLVLLISWQCLADSFGPGVIGLGAWLYPIQHGRELLHVVPVPITHTNLYNICIHCINRH